MKNLKSIRTKMGLSVYKLSKLADITGPTIHRIEKTHNARLDIAILIADALNVSLDELCGRENNRKEFTGKHEKLLSDAIANLVELEDEFYDG